MQKIAVFYLARLAEGMHHIDRFASSYRANPAGEPHDLYIICKGDMKPGERAAIVHMFSGIEHKILEVSDEGYDIQAYLKVTKKVSNTELCFFNTFTVLLSPQWLKKLATQFRKSGVGVAGMTASFESLQDSWEKINKVIWFAAVDRVRYNRRFAEQFYSTLMLHHPSWLTAHNSKLGRLKRFVGDFRRKRVPYDSAALDHGFEKYWHDMTRGHYARFKEFARFPNPHLRTNGFLISRDLFLEYDGMGSAKTDCMAFESGADGLSSRVIKRGLQVVLVGANGEGYLPSQWVKSSTFRLGDQSNLMASDNQVSSFGKLSPKEKTDLVRMTWGDYLAPAPEGFIDLGFSFPAYYRPGYQVQSGSKELKLSIVIPTHNRLDLLRDAIETVRRQKYGNWELVIFDNASSESIGKHVQSLNDPRIRYERSEEFLPVTDSWNRAIDFATGDYVMLIGDDDGLVPNYFSEINTLVSAHGDPDFIYSSLYQFMHPGVMPKVREGYLSEIKSGFFFVGRNKQPFLLEPKDARTAWIGSLQMKRNFTFNMQAFTFKRSFLDKLRVEGRVFHSPFPDYYLANLAMAHGKRILVSAVPLAVAGVSTASFGYTLFNKLEEKGADLLNSKIQKDPLYKAYEGKFLPGPAYQDNYILTMGHVAKHAPGSESTRYGVARYRRLQIYLFVSETHGAWMKNSPRGKELWARLSLIERIFALGLTAFKVGKRHKLLDKIRLRTSETAFYALQERMATGEFARLPEVFEMLERKFDTPLFDPLLGPGYVRASSKSNIAKTPAENSGKAPHAQVVS